MVMMVEGVLAGNQGALLYEESQILRSVEAWNHKPITLGHPENTSGQKISGCDPVALDTVGLGMVLHTKYDPRTKKLKAEAWFDKARLDAVPGAEAIKMALNTGKKTEVSTGLFVDVIQDVGVWNGKDYVGKTLNFRPDHLAILLNEEGASSIKDGAGLLANQKTEELPAPKLAKFRETILTANSEDSLMSLVDSVRAAVYTKYEKPDQNKWVYIEDIYEDAVVFCVEGKCYKENYAEDDGTVTLLGNVIEVTREVTYEPLVANEKAQMDRNTLIEALGDEHKDFVTNMSDAQVSALLKLKAEAPAPKAPEAPVVNSLEDVLKLAPAGVKAVVEQALATNAKVRDELVAKVVANKANQFTEDELKAFSNEVLEKLAGLALAANAATPEPKFAGSQGGSKPSGETALVPSSVLS